MIRFVCFDLGGVLVRTQHDIFQACTDAGLSAPAGWRSGTVRRDFAREMFELESGQLTDEGFAQKAAVLLPPWDASDVLALMDIWLLGLYPGVSELLSELSATSKLVGCLSNTNGRHCDTLLKQPDYLPLQRHLDHHFFSHEIGARKPDPVAYEHVERHMAGIEPESILFFDDRPENIDAARERRWMGEQIEPHGDPIGQIRALLSVHRVL